MTASCFRPSSSTPILWPWKPKVMTTEDTEAASEKRIGLSKVLIHCGILISSAFYHRLPQIWDKKNLALKLLTGWMSFKMNKSTSCTVSKFFWKQIIKIGSFHVILERNIGEFKLYIPNFVNNQKLSKEKHKFLHYTSKLTAFFVAMRKVSWRVNFAACLIDTPTPLGSHSAPPALGPACKAFKLLL